METKKLTNYITPSITKKERFGPWIISINIRRCHLSHLSYCWSSLSNKEKLYTWILWAVFSWRHYFLRRLKRILILSKSSCQQKRNTFWPYCPSNEIRKSGDLLIVFQIKKKAKKRKEKRKQCKKAQWFLNLESDHMEVSWPN